MRTKAILLCCLMFLASLPIAPQEVIRARRRVPAGGGTTWSIAHQALVSNNQTSGVARSLTYTTTAAATTIEVACAFYGGDTNSITSITDNATGGSSTWQTSGAGSRGHNSSVNGASEIWYSYIKSGATTATINLASTSSVFAYFYELNGIATASPVDIVNNQTNVTGSGTNQPGASITTTVTGDFIVGCDAPDLGSISGVSSGYTADSTASGVGFTHFTSTAATAAAHQVTYTGTSSGDHYETSDAAFKHN